jgi:uncharacterized protein (TIGR02757 family)
MPYEEKIANLLDYYYNQYNHKAFINDDPISIPHRFTIKQDIEIAAFFSAIIAWGQRKTIIANAHKLMQLMDNAPYQFIRNHQDKDLLVFEKYVHRTFNSTDLLFFIAYFKDWYQIHDSMETLFFPSYRNCNIKQAISNAHCLLTHASYFPSRTRKHIANPLRNSTCKRLNMFLRWMVRCDDHGVDFGLWKSITPAQLMCPLDVHVENYGRQLGLITRKSRDWATVEELTTNLSLYCAEDPVKFDYALFGMGIEKVIL